MCSQREDGAALQFDVLRGDAGIIDEIGREWDELCDRGGFTEPFFRPYLASAYITSFAPHSTVVVVTVRSNQRLVAVLPMVERSFGIGAMRVRWLHSTSNVHFMRFDVVHADVDPDRLSHELWQFLSASTAWDVIQIDAAPADGVADRLRLAARAGGALSELHRPVESPYITIGKSGMTLEEIIQARTSSMRAQLRRAMRRLEGRGQVSFTHLGAGGDEADMLRAVREFYRLEHRSWKGEAGTSILSDPATHSFYDRLVRKAMERGEFSINRLDVDGHVVAVAFGLDSGRTHFGLKVTHDSDFDRCSPGHLITLHTLAEMSPNGCTEFDLGGTTEPYKQAWTDTARPYGSVFLFRPGVRGHLVWNLLFKLGPAMKSRVGTSMLVKKLHRILV